MNVSRGSFRFQTLDSVLRERVSLGVWGSGQVGGGGGRGF